MKDATTRTCTKCGETKPLDAFHKRHRNTQRREAHCKVCHNVLAKRWREQNPEKFAEMKRLHRERHRERLAAERIQQVYGITMAQWNAILEQQGKACAICGRTEPGPKGWQTDHCHATGRVRGILCRNCNVAIGLFKDSAETLLLAHAYVAFHHPQSVP